MIFQKNENSQVNEISIHSIKLHFVFQKLSAY